MQIRAAAGTSFLLRRPCQPLEFSMPLLKNDRFKFGQNWSSFLSVVNEERMLQSQQSLCHSLQLANLEGLRLLDVGCGSGLFSLAARRLGARVHSFDYDSDSVGCTLRLKEQFYPSDENWTIEQGSALDRRYLTGLGEFDIVYSFGVLHHTGDLWAALDQVTVPLKPCGKLLVGIYNDQETQSRRWWYLKQRYNRGSVLTKRALEGIVWWEGWGQYFLRDLIRLKPFRTWRIWKSYASQRGMSPWHDVVDWAGGFPFEVAKPEQVFAFYLQRGFALKGLKTCGGGKGCNEFLFIKG